ncbi:molybdopterin guanine dinucleotide biosynthesis protein MoaE [Sphingomonas metalli]|uniref:Molybdopterin synthase catalytic subunit n=1 Tax=Sphingomonas metalli TaxID=1779358 RepID=A0A916SSM3_9SPHN|nr:molybdenum cofactor biosynthesis protein MoaE [Sphingomonas metalli]GGB16082.1 molybdopterin guanine dinucleotide biosynthesis protein MoaE [Sphingomonas metalli]
MIRILVSPAIIDLSVEMDRIEAGHSAGAIATFTGLVRADAKAEGKVETLELEHYPGATEAALHALAGEAEARWSLSGATIVHRVGMMAPGDRIVFVGTAAAHRGAALDACAFLIDRLKTDAPFWKRETSGGEARWVEARASDDRAAERWRDA